MCTQTKFDAENKENGPQQYQKLSILPSLSLPFLLHPPAAASSCVTLHNGVRCAIATAPDVRMTKTGCRINGCLKKMCSRELPASAAGHASTASCAQCRCRVNPEPSRFHGSRRFIQRLVAGIAVLLAHAVHDAWHHDTPRVDGDVARGTPQLSFRPLDAES